MSAIGSAARAIRAYVGAIVGWAQREPVRTFGILRSAFLLALAFWPGLVTPEQTAALSAFVVAWLGIDEVVRKNVTPTIAPVVPTGTEVTVTDPDPGIPDVVVKVA